VLGELSTEEHLVFSISHGYWADRITHSKPHHHVPRQLGGVLDILSRSSSDLVGTKNELFRYPASIGGCQLSENELLGVVMSIFLRKRESQP
jgi:hypothetical protein